MKYKRVPAGIYICLCMQKDRVRLNYDAEAR